jgi:DNA-binding SARP family transcriptional activator
MPRVDRVARYGSRPPKTDYDERADIAHPGTAVRAHEKMYVDLLGWFVLRRQCGVVSPLPKKAQALLAYLLMHPGRPIARERLSALLWDQNGSEHADRSLRQCLVSIRTALAPLQMSVISSDGAQVRLVASERLEVDVHSFNTLARSDSTDDLESALQLYRDEFLAGLQITSDSFNEWAQYERRRLASSSSDLLYRLAFMCEAAGNASRAIAVSQRLTEFDSIREDGHRLLMHLLAAAGQRSRALRQYSLLVAILRNELAIAPEKETSQLADRIRNDEIPRSLNSH